MTMIRKVKMNNKYTKKQTIGILVENVTEEGAGGSNDTSEEYDNGRQGRKNTVVKVDRLQPSLKGNTYETS